MTYKEKIDHWLLIDIKVKFNCKNTNYWDPYPLKLTNTEIVGYGYQVLENGIRGP